MIDLKDKNISVIGAVRSGIGAAKLIKKLGGKAFVSDMSDNAKIKKSAEVFMELGIDYELGGHTNRVFDCELMVVSPGVPSNAEILSKAKEKNIKVISELELAAGFCKGKIIAITGTNGKTTTTSLCAHVFKVGGKKIYTAGNIGFAFSEIALDVRPDEYVSLEVSSFQLDLIDTFKPQVAAILNITPDHLNRYENKFEKYIESKLRVFKNQDSGDFLILNKDDPGLMNSLPNYKSKNFYFSLSEPQYNGCYLSGEELIFNEYNELKFSCSVKNLSLKGEHNYQNAMAVIIAAKIYGLDNERIREALGSFKGVEHRLEFVREIDGVIYINDSKGTNVDSVWYALRSFDNPIFLILGGQDKGNDYNKIKDLVLKKVKKIYAIGSSAEKVFNFFHHDIKVEIKGTLEEVVITANSEARKNDVVLLSPACASFDMFDNYEHRGEVFKEAVNKL
ncbi:MAG TPA: UDP-N-acetylmuramoyl-L-alanine--D-glutamate ligase [Ignavibacteriaceae bacterium]|nr:UDP-N-acetylmuramoyl-L-alanine--D-glutamate ligase [Ignavibacteriaceae bacterium]